jgi:hypothetical protein
MNTTTTEPPRGLEGDAFTGLVLNGRRHVTITLRWRGLGSHNVLGAFPTLASASSAARRLNVRPECVSSVVLVPLDATQPAHVVLGVHTADQIEANDAALSLQRSGASSVTHFVGPADHHAN